MTVRRHFYSDCRIATVASRFILFHMRSCKFVASFILLLLSLVVTNSSHGAVLFGSKNQRLEVSKTKISSGDIVTVKGKRFDPEVGLYLSFCKIPNPREQPTPCGGINMEERSNTGYWISSNAPSYAKGLTIPFKKNGSFQVKLNVDRMIGEYRCGKNDCAVTVRADHLRTGDRSHDLFIPINFKK